MPSDTEWRNRLAEKIKLAMKAKGWTQVKLAEVSGYDERTIRNILKGRSVKSLTQKDICSAVGLSIENIGQEDDPVSIIELGGYSKASMDIYIGYYSIYRRSFTAEGEIVKAFCQVSWDDNENCLVFEELYNDKEHNAHKVLHSGTVYFALDTPLMHFLTTDRGSLRMITLTQIRMQDRMMRGAIISQVEKISFYQPTVSPIFFKLLGKKLDGETNLDTGYVAKNTKEYDFAEKELIEVEKNILKFVK